MYAARAPACLFPATRDFEKIPMNIHKIQWKKSLPNAHRPLAALTKDFYQGLLSTSVRFAYHSVSII